MALRLPDTTSFMSTPVVQLRLTDHVHFNQLNSTISVSGRKYECVGQDSPTGCYFDSVPGVSSHIFVRSARVSRSERMNHANPRKVIMNTMGLQSGDKAVGGAPRADCGTIWCRACCRRRGGRAEQGSRRILFALDVVVLPELIYVIL